MTHRKDDGDVGEIAASMRSRLIAVDDQACQFRSYIIDFALQ